MKRPQAKLEKRVPRKNPHAVALGRMGGLKGGRARAEKLTHEELSAQGRHAANTRWGKIPGKAGLDAA